MNTPTAHSPGRSIQLALAGEAMLSVSGGPPLALGPLDAALLAWLALEGPTPRARLVALLWPDSDADAARNNLRQRLFRLHKQAGADVVVGTATLALAAQVAHDLDDADTVLAALPGDIGGEFATWLEAQRVRRHERLTHALLELADMAERAGDLGDALIHADEVLGLQPLSEQAHRRVMRLHYLAGDRAAALLAFDRCERVLKDEIGARPSAETLALLHTIEQSVTADGPSTAPARVPASMLRPPRRIGRAAAWQALCAVRDMAQVLLLAGEAGMGKSRLMTDLANADPGVRPAVLCIAARPGDAAVPYATLCRLLRRLLAGPGLAPPPAWRAILAHLLPELAEPAPTISDGDAARLAQAVLAWLDAAAHDGLRALLIDDLHFADDASVALVPQLIGHGRWGCALAMRRGELGAATRAIVDTLEADAQVTSLALEPLTADEVGDLLDSLGVTGIGGAAQAQALNRHTGGNPLFVLETVKATYTQPSTSRAVVSATNSDAAPIVWSHAPTVQRLIQQRLARLSPRAVQVARCAAVAGQDCSAELVAQVLGCRPLDLADAWTELEAAQVLSGDGFTHDLVTDAVLSGVPKAVARPLHGEAAQWLELHNGEPARIANHWLAADQPARAAPHLLAASTRARGAWRMLEAAFLAEQAGRIWLDAGNQDAAFDAFFAAADLFSEAEAGDNMIRIRDAMVPMVRDDAQASTLAVIDAAALLAGHQFDRARDVALQGAAQAQRAGLAHIEAELLWVMTAIHWERREVADALRRAEQAFHLLDGIDPAERRNRQSETRQSVRHALGVLNTALGRYEQSSSHLLASHQELERSNVGARLMDIETGLSLNALEMGDLESARRWSLLAAEHLEQSPKTPNDLVRVLGVRVRIVAAHGDLGEALACNERIAARNEATQARGAALYALIRQAMLWYGIGRRDLALRALMLFRAKPEWLGVERAFIEAALLSIGESGDAPFVLAQVADCDDFSLRVRILCLAQPGLPADQVLALLSGCQSTARDNAAHGLWLELQVHRVAVLRALGRAAEATDAAIKAWQRFESGVRCSMWLPDMAARLCPALAASQADLAQVIALRASAWMQAAASTLPAEWRGNYLSRAPALGALQALPHLPMVDIAPTDTVPRRLT